MTNTPNSAQTDHVSEFGRWTLFRRKPRRALAPYVHEIQGYFEEGGATIVRREVPSGAVPLILVFGPRGFTLWDRAGMRHGGRLDRSFIAGLHEQYSWSDRPVAHYHAVVTPGVRGDFCATT